MALEPAMLARGAVGSYRELLDCAVHAAPSHGDSPRIELLGAHVRQIRARLDAPRGRVDRALADLATCLRVAEREGDAHWRGQILLDLGVAHHRCRELVLARSFYQAALPLLVSANDARAEGRCMANLGALGHDEGDFPAAAAWYRRAIALFEAAGDARQRANCTGNLAVLAHELGEWENAESLYENAQNLLEPVGDARRLAITLGNFGVLQLELGSLARALALCQRSLALIEGSGDERSEALSFGRLAAALALLGRTDDAEAMITQGERLALASDSLVVHAVGLQRALLELVRDENTSAARTAIERVRRARAGERSLADQSDDIRATLRILETELARLARPER
jgi:tetratricopeptide (TPR) repeat protein